MSCSLRKHIDTVTLCFCIYIQSHNDDIFFAFQRELCSSIRAFHRCRVAEDEYDAAAMFKNNRDRMGYGFGVKLGYHLLKHLKRHRGFVVHTPELFWAIARLFPLVSFFCSNAPFDTRRRARAIKANLALLRLTASYPQCIRFPILAVLLCRSIEIQVLQFKYF